MGKQGWSTWEVGKVAGLVLCGGIAWGSLTSQVAGLRRQVDHLQGMVEKFMLDRTASRSDDGDITFRAKVRLRTLSDLPLRPKRYILGPKKGMTWLDQHKEPVMSRGLSSRQWQRIFAGVRERLWSGYTDIDTISEFAIQMAVPGCPISIRQQVLNETAEYARQFARTHVKELMSHARKGMS